MKNLVKTKDYLLLLDIDSEIQEGLALNPFGEVEQFDYDWQAAWSKESIGKCKNILAYTPLHNDAKELDLPLLPDYTPEEFVPFEGMKPGIKGLVFTIVDGKKFLVGNYKY